MNIENDVLEILWRKYNKVDVGDGTLYKRFVDYVVFHRANLVKQKLRYAIMFCAGVLYAVLWYNVRFEVAKDGYLLIIPLFITTAFLVIGAYNIIAGAWKNG